MKSRIGSTGLTTVISMALPMAFLVITWAAPVSPAGVTTGSQSLAGTMAEEAEATVQEYVDGLPTQSVTPNVDGQDVVTTAGELDFHQINTDAIDEVASQYAGGNPIKRYMIERDLAATPADIELETEMDSAKVRASVNTRYQGITAEPRNASTTRENGQFVITDSVSGRAVDVTGAEATPSEALEAGLGKPIEVTVQVTEEQPVVTSEVPATIQDVPGIYATDFSSSSAVRSANLAVDAARTSGYVLMSGSVLSGYKRLQPFITANGYETAVTYENDQVVGNIRGNVYQLATTLYDASLEVKVEIIQRRNHSMIVTYVKPSRDAAVADTYKDIKIQNNYNTPIYVEGYTFGRKLILTIYDKETRPVNHKVEYVSETLGSTNPDGPRLIVDNTLAPGARVKVQPSHTGLRSRLWRVVTVDGVEQERILLNKDAYSASKTIHRAGPDLSVALPVVPDVTTPVDITPAETAPTKTTSATGMEGGPGVTRSAPEATPALEANPAANPVPAGRGPMTTPVGGPQCGRPDKDRADLRNTTTS